MLYIVLEMQGKLAFRCDLLHVNKDMNRLIEL